MTFEEQSLRTVIMVCSKEGALVPDPIIKAICKIFDYANATTNLLRYILWLECAIRTSDPTTLLRDNTVVNKLIVNIGKDSSAAFFCAMSPLSQDLLNSTVDFEVVPERIRMRSDAIANVKAVVKRNSMSLQKWAQRFVFAIIDSQMSADLIQWIKIIVCPFLIEKAKSAPVRPRRNLILLSKVIQKVANGVPFDRKKERNFIYLNNWAVPGVTDASITGELIQKRNLLRFRRIPPPPPPRKAYAAQNKDPSSKLFRAPSELSAHSHFERPIPSNEVSPNKSVQRSVSIVGNHNHMRIPSPSCSPDFRALSPQFAERCSRRKQDKSDPGLRVRRQRSSSQPIMIPAMTMENFWQSQVPIPSMPATSLGAKPSLPPTHSKEVRKSVKNTFLSPCYAQDEIKNLQINQALTMHNLESSFVSSRKQTGLQLHVYQMGRAVCTRRITSPPPPPPTPKGQNTLCFVLPPPPPPPPTPAARWNQNGCTSGKQRAFMPDHEILDKSERDGQSSERFVPFWRLGLPFRKIFPVSKKNGNLGFERRMKRDSCESQRKKSLLQPWQGWEVRMPAPVRTEASALAQYLRFVAEFRHPGAIGRDDVKVEKRSHSVASTKKLDLFRKSTRVEKRTSFSGTRNATIRAISP
eukprot:jgi/Bigna1/132606/aug1.18_g7314